MRRSLLCSKRQSDLKISHIDVRINARIKISGEYKEKYMTKTEQVNHKFQDNQELEIDLIDLLYYFRSKLIYIILMFLIGAVAAGAITRFVITPKYTATSVMYMVSSSSGSVVDLSDINIGTSMSADYIELMKTRPIIEGVISDLNLDKTYEEVLDMVSLSVKPSTRIIMISVTSADPEEAMDIANAIAERTEVQLPKTMGAPKPNIAEDAILPINPSSPSLTKNTMLGALGMLVLALGILTLRYITNDTIKSSDDVEKYFGVLPLTVIPESNFEGIKKDDSVSHRKKNKAKNDKKRRQKNGR